MKPGDLSLLEKYGQAISSEKRCINKDWPPPLSVKGTNVSNVFEECMYHEPELQDEAALSAWIAIWSPRIGRDEGATRNLITQIFQLEDPDFLPYLLLLAGCLEDQSFSSHLAGAGGRMFLDVLRSAVDEYRSLDEEHLAKIRHIERIMEDAKAGSSH